MSIEFIALQSTDIVIASIVAYEGAVKLIVKSQDSWEFLIVDPIFMSQYAHHYLWFDL